jgi:hypothetical protein
MKNAPQWEAPPLGAPYLNRPGALLFQSGPESTGYPKDLNFPPVLNIRPLDLSLRLESRGPICPQGLHKKQVSKKKLVGKSVDSGATPDSDFLLGDHHESDNLRRVPLIELPFCRLPSAGKMSARNSARKISREIRTFRIRTLYRPREIRTLWHPA